MENRSNKNSNSKLYLSTAHEITILEISNIPLPINVHHDPIISSIGWIWKIDKILDEFEQLQIQCVYSESVNNFQFSILDDYDDYNLVLEIFDKNFILTLSTDSEEETEEMYLNAGIKMNKNQNITHLKNGFNVNIPYLSKGNSLYYRFFSAYANVNLNRELKRSVINQQGASYLFEKYTIKN